MLHHPPAHRRADRPQPLIPQPRVTSPPRLFLGLGDLPRNKATHCWQDPRTGAWILLGRYGADFGEIAHDYAYSTALPPWVGRHMYRVYGAVPPTVSEAAYRDTHWWHDDWPVDEAALMVAGQMAADLSRPGHPLVDILDPYAAGGLGTLAV